MIDKSQKSKKYLQEMKEYVDFIKYLINYDDYIHPLFGGETYILVEELDEYDVNSENIGDFLNIARKYDVDYVMKHDKSTNLPTYRIFFSAGKTDNFKKAFSKYVNTIDSQLSRRGEMSREQLRKETEKVVNQPKRQQKQREKSSGGICVEIPENRT